jgi:ATP-dependent Clp protease ATP-binding subunit ClpX
VPPQGGRKHPHQEFIQVDTKNILFICGGAFVGLDTIIEQRIGQKTMGFGADIQSKTERKLSETLASLQPGDLLKYGLIPEFIGRMPVVATLEELNEQALIDILTRPKNALIKQYQKLLSLEGCKLKFSDDALVAVAKKAISRKTGARGLRAILEDVMLNVMYDVPSQPGIRECIINAEVINEGAEPLLIYEKIA